MGSAQDRCTRGWGCAGRGAGAIRASIAGGVPRLLVASLAEGGAASCSSPPAQGTAAAAGGDRGRTFFLARSPEAPATVMTVLFLSCAESELVPPTTAPVLFSLGTLMVVGGSCVSVEERRVSVAASWALRRARWGGREASAVVS